MFLSCLCDLKLVLPRTCLFLSEVKVRQSFDVCPGAKAEATSPAVPEHTNRALLILCSSCCSNRYSYEKALGVKAGSTAVRF